MLTWESRLLPDGRTLPPWCPCGPCVSLALSASAAPGWMGASPAGSVGGERAAEERAREESGGRGCRPGEEQAGRTEPGRRHLREGVVHTRLSLQRTCLWPQTPVGQAITDVRSGCHRVSVVTDAHPLGFCRGACTEPRAQGLAGHRPEGSGGLPPRPALLPGSLRLCLWCLCRLCGFP